ncbi:hypothetical protein IUY40_18485 [Flavobacterium sp. ALJ2]|uniref:hypothetical protein n=1 Tax=Flavobacterium sp. ALJ2 TaxID=2786960 RepID=UPI00189D6017|nr:hypothetical protein [Flavobacterium sp. ALJ2]MBF7093524.1 hypothetical protein [Flavobacterium sp. ALJ2]
MKYRFKKNDYHLENGEVVYEIGVDRESLDKEIFALSYINWHGWTIEEAQLIIDESKKITGKELYNYVVPGNELSIWVDKDYASFFDWRTPQEEEDFSWTFNEFINFMEAFKEFISKNKPKE